MDHPALLHWLKIDKKPWLLRWLEEKLAISRITDIVHIMKMSTGPSVAFKYKRKWRRLSCVEMLGQIYNFYFLIKSNLPNNEQIIPAKPRISARNVCYWFWLLIPKVWIFLVLFRFLTFNFFQFHFFFQKLVAFITYNLETLYNL